MQLDRQMMPMNTPLARGSTASARSNAIPGNAVMSAQSGHVLLAPAINIIGAITCPTTSIVSQAGPSSA